MQEQILTGKQSVEYRGKRSRQQIKDNLKRFKETLQRQKERIAQLEELKEQTMMLNKAYIKIGTKKELKAQGFLTGGLFSKKKLDPAKLRSENFQEVDMRTVNDLIVHSSGPKILTQMPTSSYRFVNNGNGTYTLHILSPGDRHGGEKSLWAGRSW